MRKPWLMARDFNDNANVKEKKRGAPIVEKRYQEFMNWINQCVG